MLPLARDQPGRIWVTPTAPVASTPALSSACKLKEQSQNTHQVSHPSSSSPAPKKQASFLPENL